MPPIQDVTQQMAAGFASMQGDWALLARCTGIEWAWCSVVHGFDVHTQVNIHPSRPVMFILCYTL